MKESLTIVVGNGEGGQDNIINSLREKGYYVIKNSDITFPRDSYVNFNGQYVKQYHAGRINQFGEGGNLRLGDKYLLISDMVYFSYLINKEDRKKPCYDEVKRAIISTANEYFPGVRIHVVPTGYFSNSYAHKHIDMYTLLCPNRGLLVVDTYFGGEEANSVQYNEIAEKEGLKLIRYNGFHNYVWYPLNALALPNDNMGDTVVVDNKAISLIKILKDEGIEVIEVKMPQHPPAGKINCQTNTLMNPDDISIETLF